MEIGKVYHISFKDGERNYFKPISRNKGGSWKGLVMDGGASGRSKNKPIIRNFHIVSSLWQETPTDDIPKQLRD